MALACAPAAKVNPAIVGILGFGLWSTGSFAALGAASFVLFVELLRRELRFRALAKAAAVAVAIVAFVGLVAPVLQLLGLPGVAAEATVPTPFYSGYSLAERLKSMQGGLALFLQHPVFGAGLGAYMEAQTRLGDPLVIHSAPLGLLAEMGVVGFSIFGWFGWRLALAAIRGSDSESSALLFILAGFCTMAAVHDMMYQRSIWLLVGALLVRSVAGHARPSDGEASVA